MPSPYEKPDFYSDAIAAGRHRDIVGGRWDETGRAQMALLRDAGLAPHHHLLDIGAGSLRLGCKAVPFLDPGHYWATDASREMLLAGRDRELPEPERLDPAQLVADATFDFPGVPDSITHAIAFAVFPHLTGDLLARAIVNARRFPRLEAFFLTVFLAPDAEAARAPYRQPDGVVTHPGRVPFHVLPDLVPRLGAAAGWQVTQSDRILPRGQVLYTLRPV